MVDAELEQRPKPPVPLGAIIKSALVAVEVATTHSNPTVALIPTTLEVSVTLLIGEVPVAPWGPTSSKPAASNSIAISPIELI
jgi:hypothetical protein